MKEGVEVWRGGGRAGAGEQTDLVGDSALEAGGEGGIDGFREMGIAVGAVGEGGFGWVHFVGLFWIWLWAGRLELYGMDKLEVGGKRKSDGERVHYYTDVLK